MIEDILLLGLILGGLERMYTGSLAAVKHYIPPDKKGVYLEMISS